ncbi:MAG: hypothetical protein QME78_03160 [Thermodesulfobacteriota bacterium]|nr:hypothetical protein [Thermodesulfobacteriota bacterium]
MKKMIPLNVRTLFLGAALIVGFIAGNLVNWRDTSIAAGGPFAPQMTQQGGKYQIAGRDGNSAWVIDTVMGDVYLIYSNGKWKEVGSIMDEKKRIKK